ncbi:unnamed protein product [Paramecium sonneborni]|uniref:Uncharacterized protein n=1 Tax=Paramecium sonneborni TaxID=65129 RepID=A0A8S1R3R9_9CILI|nr:unnamed protein product [Paramecium sonneborni]
MNTFYAQNLSLSQLRQLPQERMHVKMYKNEEITLTPQSNRSQLNEAIENLEMQWQSIRRQHLEQRSCSRSPAKNNLMNQLLKNKDKQQQCILKKVVPLSTINLAKIQDQQQQQQFQYNPQQSAQRNHLKDSSHFQYIANKYCNIYRRPSPEQQYLVNSLRENEQINYSIGRNQVQQQQYQRNNLKMLDERVRVNSQDKYAAQALSNSNIMKKEGPQRKRVSQYYNNEENKITSVKSAGMQNQRIIPKKRP